MYQQDTTIRVYITIVMPDGIKLADRTIAFVNPDKRVDAGIDLAALQLANRFGWNDQEIANYLPYLDIQINDWRD
jgi:hypothetical protein